MVLSRGLYLKSPGFFFDIIFRMVNLVFFLSGFIAIFVQTFLLREIQLVFHGNELSIGLALSLWLLGVAAGSVLAAMIVKTRGAQACRKILALTFLSAGPYLMLSLFFIREIRNIFGFFAGVELPLLSLLWFSASIFIPAGALIGSQFSLGIGWLGKHEDLYKSGRIYLWETLGFFAGGLPFTFLLLINANPVFIATIILQISSAAALILTEEKKQKIMLTVFIALFFPVLFYGAKLEKAGISRLYPGYNVAEVRNTPYGQLAAVSRGGENFFFSDGIPLETFGAPNREAAENNALLPLLFHPKPRSILLIGGTGRYFPVLESGKADSLEYVEMNPWLVDFINENTKTPLFDKEGKINVQYREGRKYIENVSIPYDAIFADIPYPVTLSLNRYYTREFYKAVKGKLAPG